MGRLCNRLCGAEPGTIIDGTVGSGSANTFTATSSSGFALLSMVQSTCLLFQLPLSLTPVTVTGFLYLTVSYYNLHKYADTFPCIPGNVHQGPVSGPVRPIDRWLFLIAILWLLVLYQAGWLISLVSLVMATVSLVYSVPAILLSEEKTVEELVYPKLSVLSFVWAVMTVTLPLLESGIPLSDTRPILLTVNVVEFYLPALYSV